VIFGANANGILLSEDDLLCATVNPDEWIYEMATSYIANAYPPASPPMHAQIYAMIYRCLGSVDCSASQIAAKLCIHPRTLQRRLNDDGQSLERIKDNVRRDLALLYLQRDDLSISRIAERLGYSEPSVLCRSCYRWFSVSPRQLRKKLRNVRHIEHGARHKVG
jgi:AraC-like DNA-binding protein